MALLVCGNFSDLGGLQKHCVVHHLRGRCVHGKQNGKYLRFSNRGSH